MERTAMNWSDQGSYLWKTTGCADMQQFRCILTVLLETLRSEDELGLDDFASNRVPDKFVGRVEAEFEHDFSSVRLSRADSDSQRGCDLLIRFPFGQQADDFKLARS
jgi:hypothetical protein